jgi:hypothetical protein
LLGGLGQARAAGGGPDEPGHDGFEMTVVRRLSWGYVVGRRSWGDVVGQRSWGHDRWVAFVPRQVG